MAFTGLRESYRARQLAGATRAGSWARAKARREQREYLRERWLRFTVALLVWFAVVAGAAALMPNELVRGIVIGAAVVAGPGAIWVLVMQVTGTAPTMMGETAEQWTAQELRPLTRRGWRLVNHFGLGRDDIDHLLVGPGGAFVVETKWSSQSWESDSGLDRQRAAVRQATANARRVSLWTPFRTNGIAVRPVVVLWGSRDGGTRRDTPPTDVDGTLVLEGPSLRRWVEQAGGTVSVPALERVWPAVLDQVARRDVAEQTASPMPMSVWDFALRGIGCLISTLLAALAVGQVLRLTQSLWPTMLGAVILAAVGVAVSRWRPARWFGWAWTVGAALSSAAVLIAVASFALRQSP